MKLHSRQQHIIDVYGREPQTLDEIAEATIAVLSQSTKVVGFAWNVHYERHSSNSHYAPINGVTNWGGRNSPDAPTGYPAMFGRVWIRYETNPEFMSLSDKFRDALSYPGTGGGGAYNGIWEPISHAVYKTRTFGRPNAHGHRKAIYLYPQPDCYSWDYRFFLDDWPGLQSTILSESQAFDEEQDKQVVWHKLNVQYYRRLEYSLHHNFKWEDPEVLRKDKEFIEIYKELKEKKECT